MLGYQDINGHEALWGICRGRKFERVTGHVILDRLTFPLCHLLPVSVEFVRAIRLLVLRQLAACKLAGQ